MNLNYKFIAFIISASSEEVFLTSQPEYFIAESGSFRPFPVRIHTIFLFSSMRPSFFAFITPATEAALAGYSLVCRN